MLFLVSHKRPWPWIMVGPLNISVIFRHFDRQEFYCINVTVKMPPEDEIPGTHLKLSVKRVKLSYRYSSHVTIYTSLTKSDHTAPVSNGLIYMSH